MKSNKYWNTMWSERDQEFIWSGIVIGFITSAVLTSALWIDGILLVDSIKNHKKI